MSADALRDELLRLKAQLAAEHTQAAQDAAADRDRRARIAQDRHDHLLDYLGGLTTLITEQTSEISACTAQIRREAALTSQRQAEQDARLDSVQATLTKIHEGQEANRARVQHEARPNVDSIIHEIRQHSAEQKDSLMSLADQLQEDARRRHEELQSHLLASASARESMAFSTSDES